MITENYTEVYVKMYFLAYADLLVVSQLSGQKLYYHGYGNYQEVFSIQNLLIVNSSLRHRFPSSLHRHTYPF